MLVLPGEGSDGAVGTLALREVGAYRIVVVDGALDAAGDDHCTRLTAYLLQTGQLLMEVVHHDLRLEADRVLVVLHVAAQLLAGATYVELRVSLDRFDQPVVAVDRRVVRQHVNDEALLDRLLHRVGMERQVLSVAALLNRRAKDLQRLVLRRGGEGEVAGVAAVASSTPSAG